MRKGLKIGIVVLVVVIVFGFIAYIFTTERTAVQNLEVKLTAAAVTRKGLTSCDIALDLSFHNPTGHNTPPFSSEFDVYIDNHFVGNGSLPETAIPAYSNKTSKVTITFYYANVAIAVKNAIMEERFTVKVNGSVTGRILVGLITVSRQFSITHEVI